MGARCVEVRVIADRGRWLRGSAMGAVIGWEVVNPGWHVEFALDARFGSGQVDAVALRTGDGLA